MYLSKIHLFWYGRVDYYEVHRRLWKLFPDRENDNRTFLFRVERKLPGHGIQVLLQSHFKPKNDSPELEIVGTKEFTPKIKNGDTLRFRLLGNPIKTIKDEQGRINFRGEIKSCRVPLLSVDEQKQWLERKLSDAATLDTVTINGASPILFSKKKNRGKIQPIVFDGTLSVKDEKCFLEIFETGIGPAKAFGCGMLSLARLTQN